MVKITVKYLQTACKEHLNIADQVKNIQVDNFVHFILDEFFEVSLGLIYQATRTCQETFWLWAARDKEVVAFVGIDGSPQGIFVFYFEGTAQW